MASLCRYSHPERLDTSGLEQQSVGTLFPYNTDLYDKASGLYGPGTVICWYLLLASFLLNCVFCSREPVTRHRGSKVTTDLVALALYPVFAATDALVQALALVGVRGRGLVLYCLRYPHENVNLPDESNGLNNDLRVPPSAAATAATAPLDLRHIPDDIVAFGQKIIALSGPIPGCDVFLAIVATAALGYWWFADVFLANEAGDTWKLSRGSTRLVGSAYIYVLCCRVVVQVAAGEDFADMAALTVSDATMPLLFLMVYGLGAVALLGVGCALLLALSRTIRRVCGRVPRLQPYKNTLMSEADEEILLGAGWLLVPALIAGAPSVVALWQGKLSMMPDLGISVAEADQLAALLGGVLALGFTVGSIMIERRKGDREKGVQEEMVPLAAEV